MRVITMDLSNNSCSPKVFAGFEGEHNATEVEVVLPKEMVSSSAITTFHPLFRTQWNERYVGKIVSSATDGKISILLHQAVTRKGCTELQIEGRDSENNFIAKSAIGLLNFAPSVDSNGADLGIVIKDKNELLAILNEVEDKANSAIDAAAQAAESAEAAAQSADRLVTIIDKELTVYTTLYKSDAPDWVEHNKNSVDPYASGKDVYFKADIKAGGKCLVHVWLEHQEGFKSPMIMLSTKNSGDANDRIDSYKFADYNQDLGCYEAEFVARRDTLENEELMLYVGYPSTSFGDLDLSAVFGKAEIYYTGNLQSIVDNQNIKIAAIGGDIETALEGIIAIQENLIGGDTV